MDQIVADFDLWSNVVRVRSIGLRCLICWLTQCGEPAPYPSARLFVSDLRKSLGKLQHLGSNGGPQGLLDLNLNVGKKIIVDCRSFVTGSSSSFFFILDS